MLYGGKSPGSRRTDDAKGDDSLATVSSSARDAPNNALNDDATHEVASTVNLHAHGGLIG